MKTQGVRMLVLGALMTGWITGAAQPMESEVPGDNFSLEGALELFKKSASPEDFERKLNDPDSKVNNLDLNNDRYIDYIRVIDRTRGNVHAFVLQAVLSENESQDVAVIELEKKRNGEAVLQITGDADVYGIETIIEPTEEVRTYAGTTTTRSVVNVWAWPSVQYVYSPYYEVWVSPWAWSYRPVWYRPWNPVVFNVYFGWWQPYRPYYATCHTRRIYHAHEIYRPHRTTSVIVVNNYGDQINYYRTNNSYRYERDRNHYNGNNNGGNRGNGNGRGQVNAGNGHHDNGFPRYDSDRNRPRNENWTKNDWKSSDRRNWDNSEKFRNQQISKQTNGFESQSGFKSSNRPRPERPSNASDIRGKSQFEKRTQRPSEFSPIEKPQQRNFSSDNRGMRQYETQPQSKPSQPRFNSPQNSQGSSGKPMMQRNGSGNKAAFERPSSPSPNSGFGGNKGKPVDRGGNSRGRQ